MELQLHSTDKIVTCDDVSARIWEGHTASGIAVHAYITCVVARLQDCTEFERELKEHRPPSPEIAAFPARMLL